MANEYKQLTEAELQGGIRIGDVAEMGSMVPPGRYKMKLSRIEGKPAQSGTPMVIAGFDVLDGQPAPDKDGNTPSIDSVKGLEASKFFTMYVGKADSGRIIAPGIMEAKAAFAAIGRPMHDDEIFPGNVRDAARLIHDRFVRLEVEAVVYREPDRKDKTKLRTVVKIVGLWGGASNADAVEAAAGTIIV